MKGHLTIDPGLRETLDKLLLLEDVIEPYTFFCEFRLRTRSFGTITRDRACRHGMGPSHCLGNMALEGYECRGG